MYTMYKSNSKHIPRFPFSSAVPVPHSICRVPHIDLTMFRPEKAVGHAARFNGLVSEGTSTGNQWKPRIFP